MDVQKAKKKNKDAKSRDPFKRRQEVEMIKIVQEIRSGMIGIRTACWKYGLNRDTLKRWMARISVRNLGNDLSTQYHLSDMTEEERSRALERKVKELTMALEQARLKIDGLETMIKVTEEDLHIKIRKKPGTKQSKE